MPTTSNRIGHGHAYDYRLVAIKGLAMSYSPRAAHYELRAASSELRALTIYEARYANGGVDDYGDAGNASDYN